MNSLRSLWIRTDSSSFAVSTWIQVNSLMFTVDPVLLISINIDMLYFILLCILNHFASNWWNLFPLNSYCFLSISFAFFHNSPWCIVIPFGPCQFTFIHLNPLFLLWFTLLPWNPHWFPLICFGSFPNSLRFIFIHFDLFYSLWYNFTHFVIHFNFPWFLLIHINSCQFALSF